MCYYFDDIITFEDFDPDNILNDEKSHKYFSYNLSYKTLMDAKPMYLGSIKWMDLLEFMRELDI